MPTFPPKDTSFVSFLVKIILVHVSRILLMVRNLCANIGSSYTYIHLVAAKHDTTLVDREEVPRMPWHDMSCAVVSSSPVIEKDAFYSHVLKVGPIARDAARLFIQRWNFLKATKSMHRSIVPYLMPKGEYVAQRDESKFEGTCRVQLLRSVSSWSSGIGREVTLLMTTVAIDR